MASLALLGGVAPTTWGLMRQVISFSFVGMFGAWGGAPERGFPYVR